VVAGLAFRGAPPTPEWPGSAACVFGVGTVWTLWALGTLGGNFAVLPAFRGVTVTGPYALVRHPAYAGELTLVAACWLAGAPWWSPPAAAALVALRILGEERTLARSDAWRAYARRVPWRLVPRIW
jgi:protein-S-isoprenylcysteine O-methyltransferase Ste14